MFKHDEEQVPNTNIIEPLLTTQECEDSPYVTEYNSDKGIKVYPDMEIELGFICTPNGVIKEDGKSHNMSSCITVK